MATYRQISDSEVAVDAPLTQQLMQAYKDNLTSIIEDDASAPSIKRSAISDAVSDQKLAVAGNVSIGAEQVLSVGLIDGSGVTVSLNSNQFVIAVTGRYNIQVAAFKTNTFGGGTVRAQLYVNGSIVATAGYIGSTNFISVTVNNYQLNAGDEIYIKLDEGNSLSSNAKAQVRAWLGVSVETAAFYNRIGGFDISNITVLNAPEYDQ